jgi:hypothetical protein
VGRVAQTSSRSRERLERISHHFLSGPGDGPAASGRRPILVPVLPMPGAQDLPLSLLTQALLARGRSSAILDARRGVREASRLNPSEPSHRNVSVPPAADGGGDGPTLLEGLARTSLALQPVPDLCLVPVTVDDWPWPAAFGPPLLAVATDRDGVREAYRGLKQLAAAAPTGPVGVVMTEAPDEASARLHFEKLAEGALRFLQVEVVSYGWLPAPPPPHGPVDLLGPGPEVRLATALEGIARLLVADLAAVPGAPAPAPAPAAPA